MQSNPESHYHSNHRQGLASIISEWPITENVILILTFILNFYRASTNFYSP